MSDVPGFESAQHLQRVSQSAGGDGAFQGGAITFQRKVERLPARVMQQRPVAGMSARHDEIHFTGFQDLSLIHI